MGWLDDLLREFDRPATTPALAEPRKPRPEVQTTWAQVRSPKLETGDPGEVIDIHFIVEDDTVTLTDDKGREIEGRTNSCVLQPGESAVKIAKRMALAKWRATDAPFNRPLHYQPSGVA